VIAECEKNNILLLVNYTRTWDPAFVQLRADIQAGQWGKLRSIVGTYNLLIAFSPPKIANSSAFS
jgi:predicted dehydrogenase